MHTHIHSASLKMSTLKLMPLFKVLPHCNAISQTHRYDTTTNYIFLTPDPPVITINVGHRQVTTRLQLLKTFACPHRRHSRVWSSATETQYWLLSNTSKQRPTVTICQDRSPSWRFAGQVVWPSNCVYTLSLVNRFWWCCRCI